MLLTRNLRFDKRHGNWIQHNFRRYQSVSLPIRSLAEQSVLSWQGGFDYNVTKDGAQLWLVDMDTPYAGEFGLTQGCS